MNDRPTSGVDDGGLWPAVDGLLSRSSPDRARVHGLGPLEAVRLKRSGACVPEDLELQARMAWFGMLSVRPTLERIRSCCDGPLVLMKGPEIALRYPESARLFVDIDLLVENAEQTHRQLRAAGFVEIEDRDEPFRRHHHLRPLQWPDLPLPIEIHDRPHWPEGLQPPRPGSIIDSAVPSDLQIEGVLTPDPAHHALLVAAHAWSHEPLHLLRDLLDARVFATTDTRATIERTAQAWDMRRLWQTTDRATDAVLSGIRMPSLPGLWARHLTAQRERTVLENHLCAWLAAYSALPIGPALATTARAIRNDVLRAPEEGWADKLARAVAASKNARIPLSDHQLQLGEAATRGRNRRRRKDTIRQSDDRG